jgi:ABC-type bacteriocin/lantibiotic exporter with double-glycine peptidase domain
VELPDIRQEDVYDCGAVAANIVCTYWGLNRPRSAYLRELLTNGINGTDPRTMEGFLRRQGLYVISGEMSAADLRFQTRLGRPAVVLVTSQGVGHYAVVSAVSRGGVFMQDPACGPRRQRLKDFVADWHDGDRLGVAYTQFGIVGWK